MDAVTKLAFKNLKAHKSKSVIISLFFILGITIVVMGNSFFESLTTGLKKDISENFTGDIVISTIPKQGTVSDIFYTLPSSSSINPDDWLTPAIPDLESVLEVINNTDSIADKIESQTKLITSQVFLMIGQEFDGTAESPMVLTHIFAGDENYWNTFQGITLKEGTYPSSDKDEVLINIKNKKALENKYNREFNVGDSINLMSTQDLKVRGAVISGFFVSATENISMPEITYCSPNLARSMADLTMGAAVNENIPENLDLGIMNYSEEELFGSDSDNLFTDDFSSDTLLADSLNVDDILGDTTKRDELNKADESAWQFVILKLKNPLETKNIIERINNEFQNKGIYARTMDWQQGSDYFTNFLSKNSFLFNIIILILSIVVFIVIMNTMTVSILERTSEIGTMRAIGADKDFVKKLFYRETLILAFVSIVIGIVLSFSFIGIFNSLNITVSEEAARTIFGSRIIHFIPTPLSVLSSIVVVILGSVLSNIYPVKSALKITPLKALAKGRV